MNKQLFIITCFLLLLFPTSYAGAWNDFYRTHDAWDPYPGSYSQGTRYGHSGLYSSYNNGVYVRPERQNKGRSVTQADTGIYVRPDFRGYQNYYRGNGPYITPSHTYHYRTTWKPEGAVGVYTSRAYDGRNRQYTLGGYISFY